jgi:hypothetical protein
MQRVTKREAIVEPIHSRDEVEQAFATVAGSVIRECILAGWRSYRDLYAPGLRLVHAARTRASIVYDHTLDQLQQRLGEIPKAQLVRIRGLWVLVLNDAFTIKIPKKLRSSRKLISKTYPTGQTRAFMRQDPQGAFDGFLADRTSLVVGYVLDEVAAEVEIYVTCPNGMRRNWWAFELRAPEKAASGTIMPTSPLPPAGEAPFTIETPDEKPDEGGKNT